MLLLEAIIKGLNIEVSNSFKLNVDSELNYDDDKLQTINIFINFCIKEMGIKSNFSCNLVFNKEKNNITTTAHFNPANKSIFVYAKNRMLGDVLRSVAHELKHLSQLEKDELKFPVQDVGGDIENSANAVAGELIKTFIKNDKLGEKLFEQKKGF